MKKVSRSLAMLMTLCLIVGIFVGCGTETQAPATDQPQVETTPEATPEVAGSFGTPEVQTEDKNGGMLIMQTWSDPININFYADYGGTGCCLYWSCGPMLCTYNGDKEIVPLLLDTWELSDDGLTWTIHIKENAGWSDGEPITVDDIIFSIEYFRQDTFSDYIFQRDTMYFSETPVYAKVDDYTYTVTTTVPYPTIFDFYAVNCFIIPEHVFADVAAADFHTTTVNTTPGEIVCGGPFMVTDYKIGEYVKCERNPYFWDDVYLDELYWRIASDTNSMFTALQSGDLDFTFGIGSKYQEAVDAGMQIVRTNGSSYGGKVMNTKDALLSDVNIRKAFCHIYDQQLIIDQYNGGQGMINDAFVKGMRFEDPEACVTYDHDIEAAKALIEEAGWALGSDGYYYKDGQILEVTYAFESGYSDTMAMIMQTMFEGTGVKFNIEGFESSVLEDKIDSGDFQIADVYASLGPDPANYYSDYIDGSLFGFYRTDALDQAWIDGMNGRTDEERQTAYSIMQHDLSDGAVWLVNPKGWGYYFGNARCGLDEAQFTSNGLFVYFQKLYCVDN